MEPGNGAPFTFGVGTLERIKNVGHGSVGGVVQSVRQCAGGALKLHESHGAWLPIRLEALGALEGTHPRPQGVVEHRTGGLRSRG